jgi:hypothetical protein
MKIKGVTFADIIDAYSGEHDEVNRKVEALAKKAPVQDPILDMFIEHLPNPIDGRLRYGRVTQPAPSVKEWRR